MENIERLTLFTPCLSLRSSRFPLAPNKSMQRYCLPLYVLKCINRMVKFARSTTECLLLRAQVSLIYWSSSSVLISSVSDLTLGRKKIEVLKQKRRWKRGKDLRNNTPRSTLLFTLTGNFCIFFSQWGFGLHIKITNVSPSDVEYVLSRFTFTPRGTSLNNS